MKKVKKWFFLSLAFLLLCIPSLHGNAASQRKEALRAYRTFLAERENGSSTFALAYVNHDNIPELVYGKYGTTNCQMYTYKDGKLVEVEGEFNSWKPTGYYKKKNIVVLTWNHDNLSAIHYYRMEQGGLWEKLSKEHYAANENPLNYTPKAYTRYYNIRGKRITKATFTRQLKKLAGKTKETKFKYVKNTKANRKRYLPL
jgi:hypothetical protein